MKELKPYIWLLIAFFSLTSSPLKAAEMWGCEYSNYRHTGNQQSFFHVEGGRLVENSGDVVDEFRLLEDSETAIVAAKGGSYTSEPKVMGFLLMIRKDTGQIALITASIGRENGKQAGHCRLIDAVPK